MKGDVGASLESKYNARVIKSDNLDDCWGWSGYKNSAGYGMVYFNRKLILAHRVSFYLANGYWSNLDICHKCDNPICSNPNHLFEGSRRENMRDMLTKKRGKNQKLTISEVRQIRERSKKGESSKSLAECFNLSDSHLWMIIKGRIWKHI